MSYDLHLYRIPDGLSFEEWYEPVWEEPDTGDAPVDPLIAEAAERVKARVLALLPGGEVNEYEDDFGFQIFVPDGGPQIVFGLEPAGADVNLSYGEGFEEGVALLAEIALAVAEETGLAIYDPQLGQVLTAETIRSGESPVGAKRKSEIPQRLLAYPQREEPS
ncbi:hypothetical protein [Segniliparus rugosus]|uniref:Uncharacterized protein n=1 Tax=Segniliparus rugosus (strain ATCC BAA-974 / DSM 45345 / CCUG 50838 / CIP 108380 / JCM 13579 / CDC 945) TaxID=679197 RepID=E5XM06_SEGRC|nr:hypothetical protein [Segniliparus rugosus]EFV14612.1 hypothetical protein HMPREF9336_00525 [Segniliparus rugosus ATCC BAA-974]